MPNQAAYLDLDLAELTSREGRLWSLLSPCQLCPHKCRAERLKGETGRCQTGRLACCYNYFPHFGEEAPLVGSQGSGTIFFSFCNLRCCFCQNFEISHLGLGLELDSRHIATMMLELQEMGCANINLVTPSHVLPQIVTALRLARQNGLYLPLVYNCSGYERVTVLRYLEGLVDIYLPDLKFWSAKSAKRYCQASDYPRQAKAALKEMHRQVKDLQIADNGLAQRGLLVRHLVLPGGEQESLSIIDFLAREISVDTYVNIMDQYRPCGQAVDDPVLGQGLERGQWQRIVKAAYSAGLKRIDHGLEVIDDPGPGHWR